MRAAERHFAVKLYAEDPEPEVGLYEALASAGVAGRSGPRVPRLLTWDRGLGMIAIDWLDGPTASQLVRQGQGRRAGELTASWIKRAVALPITIFVLSMAVVEGVEGFLDNAAKQLRLVVTQKSSIVNPIFSGRPIGKKLV